MVGQRRLLSNMFNLLSLLQRVIEVRCDRSAPKVLSG
jgi:hypothetical protein